MIMITQFSFQLLPTSNEWTITILEGVEERQDDKLSGAFSYDGKMVNLIFAKNKLFDILESYDLSAALPIQIKIKIKIGEGL